MSNIVRNSIATSILRYCLLASRFSRNLLLAKILGTQEYSLWVVFLVFLTYLDLLHFGLRLAGDKEIPILNGKGHTSESVVLSKQLFGGILLFSTIGSIVSAVVGILFISHVIALPNLNNSVIGFGLLASTIIIYSEQSTRYFFMLFRTQHRFIEMGIVELLFDIVTTILVILIGLSLKMQGVVIGYALSALLSTVYIFVFTKNVNKGILFKFADTAPLVRLGAPFFLINLGLLLILNTDRIVATSLLTSEDLSLYGFAVQLCSLPLLAINGLRDVLFPAFGELSSSKVDINRFSNLHYKSIVLSLYVGLIFEVCILVAGERLILYWLPNFSSAIPFLFYLSGSAVLLSISSIPHTVLIVLHRHRSIFNATLLSIILSVLSLVIGTLSGAKPVFLVALFFMVLSLSFSFSCLYYSFSALEGNAVSSLSIALRIVLFVTPFILSGYFHSLFHIFHPFLAAVLQCILVTIAPILFIIVHKDDRSIFLHLRTRLLHGTAER